jgi:thiaminase/transcriptional activator TenA
MAQRLWDGAASMIGITEKHEFLVSMVDGTLAEENFRYYVIQDALYLTDYAECFRILARNSGISQSDSDRLMAFAKGAEEDEKELHRSFFKDWKITGADEAKAMPNTLLYTSYLLQVCSTRSHAEGLAAMLPCMWIYWHVGKCMLALRGALNKAGNRKAVPAYDAWIDLYASEEFEKEVKDYIGLVDQAIADADEETIAKMQEHFNMTCRLEHMFWDQANSLMDWPELKSSSSSN